MPGKAIKPQGHFDQLSPEIAHAKMESADCRELAYGSPGKVFAMPTNFMGLYQKRVDKVEWRYAGRLKMPKPTSARVIVEGMRKEFSAEGPFCCGNKYELLKNNCHVLNGNTTPRTLLFIFLDACLST